MELKIVKGASFIDDRGIIRFVNDFAFADVKRFYQVENHSLGFIRAWHGHKNEAKYVYVSKGVALIGAVNLDTENISKYILSSEQPQILFIPSNHANGFKTLTQDCVIIFFSTSTIEESRVDDIRFPYDKWNIWNDDYR